MKVARAYDWQAKPMPERQSRLEMHHKYTAPQMERIRAGFIPKDMDDRWFIYWDQGELFLHRSWTGICIFGAWFEETDDGGARLVGARVNRHPKQYGGRSDADDAALLMRIIRSHLVKERARWD